MNRNVRPWIIRNKWFILAGLVLLAILGFEFRGIPGGLIKNAAQKSPTSDSLGTPWDTSWTQVGFTLGVEPFSDFTILENKDILAGDGLYYATFITGEPSSYTNSDGKEADLYDAELYLLTGENKTAEKAQSDLDTWLEHARTSYHLTGENTQEINGQTWQLLFYTCDPENSPYDHGVSAFGVHAATAICAELTCTESYPQELLPILTDFLNGCHYAS